ncbi:glycerate kinase [Allomuricauda sp. SCSIO 65647]|uniref:glycerate kinase n=1 Tax=Allomuricauda sp. SCSIO 65647 TaxID=2908843 RepID=UPI001F2EAFDF|nr:glycerate kinase [Muricauda sp. SCSIO 65647]UJH68598.1 glycerate kinase [Muricauda sp. SCSIO 65647]
MKFIIAPDKFKGSLTGFEFCKAVRNGLREVFKDAEIIDKPLADGGDGTMEVVSHYLNAEVFRKEVSDPLFRSIEASYAYSKETGIAYIEMAEASGMRLLSEDEMNCRYTTTQGAGELIADAISRGAKEIILGIGGSATNDGGMGMAKALGYRFMDENGVELRPVGENLINVHRVSCNNAKAFLKDISFKIACDVKNPLYGPNGATRVYALQKGASKNDVEILEHGMKKYAGILKKQFGIDVQKIPGSGAAGGMGAGAFVFLNGRLTQGIDLIKEIANFDTAIEGADWIITGEGKLDAQTLSGKTINGVLKSAKRREIPVAAFCGVIEIPKEKAKSIGITYLVGVSEGIPDIKQALVSAFNNVKKAAQKFGEHLNSIDL